MQPVQYCKYTYDYVKSMFAACVPKDWNCVSTVAFSERAGRERWWEKVLPNRSCSMASRKPPDRFGTPFRHSLWGLAAMGFFSSVSLNFRSSSSVSGVVTLIWKRRPSIRSTWPSRIVFLSAHDSPADSLVEISTWSRAASWKSVKLNWRKTRPLGPLSSGFV